MMHINIKYPYLFSLLSNKIESLKNIFDLMNINFKFNNHNQDTEYLTKSLLLNKTTLLSVSDLKGNIIYANDRFCEVSKYKLHELLGKPHNIIRHPDVPSELFKEMWQTIGNGGVWQGEIKNRAKDGSIYWVYATISPVMGANGKPIKYISVRQDITKEKLMEEELQSIKHKDGVSLYDSMRYAKYVHSTFLTPERVLHEAFPESFMIYKAQNIVSGDFYMVQHSDNKTAFILGDSTGHGVSASYISVMILNLLNGLLRKDNINPTTILEVLHNEICSIRNRNVSESFIESADMAFCYLDHDKKILEYSIAKLRGVIIREGKVIELERDKYSVGDRMYRTIKLNKYVVNVQKGDVIYLYTDGVIDQFGGEFSKKFGNKRLLELFKMCSGLPMKIQEKVINNTLINWQGENEQIDDISLVGFQII